MSDLEWGKPYWCHQTIFLTDLWSKSSSFLAASVFRLSTFYRQACPRINTHSSTVFAQSLPKTLWKIFFSTCVLNDKSHSSMSTYGGYISQVKSFSITPSRRISSASHSPAVVLKLFLDKRIKAGTVLFHNTQVEFVQYRMLLKRWIEVEREAWFLGLVNCPQLSSSTFFRQSELHRASNGARWHIIVIHPCIACLKPCSTQARRLSIVRYGVSFKIAGAAWRVRCHSFFYSCWWRSVWTLSGT